MDFLLTEKREKFCSLIQLTYICDMEKLEIYDWIKKIIGSSNNTFHFEAVDRLIILFYEKYLDGALRTELQEQREKKWNEVHDILI